MTFYKTIPQKIDDFVAEYGLPRSIIKPCNNNPCSFAIDGHYYLTMVAENELDELAKWLINERLYSKYGDKHAFLMGAPIELLDECAKPDSWEPIIREYYVSQGTKDAERSIYGNVLVNTCLREGVIDETDLDRYLNADKTWKDSTAKRDLITKYADTMTERVINRPCSWFVEKAAKYTPRFELRDLICKKKGLIDRKRTVPVALEWEMDDLGVTTSLDYLAKYFSHWDGKVRRIGEFYALFSGNPELLRTDPKTWTLMDLLACHPEETDSDESTRDPVAEAKKPKAKAPRYTLREYAEMKGLDYDEVFNLIKPTWPILSPDLRTLHARIDFWDWCIEKAEQKNSEATKIGDNTTSLSEEKSNSSEYSKKYWDDWLMDKHPDMTDDESNDFACFTNDYFKTEDYTSYKVPMAEDQFNEVYNSWRKEREDAVNTEPSYLDDDDPFAGL